MRPAAILSMSSRFSGAWWMCLEKARCRIGGEQIVDNVMITEKQSHFEPFGLLVTCHQCLSFARFVQVARRRCRGSQRQGV